MVTDKRTTPKALQFKIKQQGGTITNKESGESSSFRVLYYGNASAGSVPFMWESHPGTPKHATTESSLPPPTPPPSSTHLSETYNSSKHSTSLQTLLLSTSSRKAHVAPPPLSTSDSFISYDSSKQSTSLRTLFLASSSRNAHVVAAPSSYSLPTTPVSKDIDRKMEIRRRRAVVKSGMEDGGGGVGGDGSPTSTLCFGGGFKKVYRMIGIHGKTQNIN